MRSGGVPRSHSCMALRCPQWHVEASLRAVLPCAGQTFSLCQGLSGDGSVVLLLCSGSCVCSCSHAVSSLPSPDVMGGGETWTMRSVDHSAKASSGATWSLMQPKLAGTRPELTSPAGCCGSPDNFYEGTQAPLQRVLCCVCSAGSEQALCVRLVLCLNGWGLWSTVQRCLLCLGPSQLRSGGAR